MPEAKNYSLIETVNLIPNVKFSCVVRLLVFLTSVSSWRGHKELVFFCWGEVVYKELIEKVFFHEFR